MAWSHQYQCHLRLQFEHPTLNPPTVQRVQSLQVLDRMDGCHRAILVQCADDRLEGIARKRLLSSSRQQVPDRRHLIADSLRHTIKRLQANLLQ
jgi:hypothetical protein